LTNIKDRHLLSGVTSRAGNILAVSNMETMTKPEEFEKFHRLLTKANSEYEPFYFPLETNGKDPISNIS